MPLTLVLAIVAVLVALALWSRPGAQRSGRQLAVTSVAVWVALLVSAIVALAIGTLIFGR